MQLLGIGVAVGKIETTKQPFLRTGTVPRVNMKIALAHALRFPVYHQSLLGDPFTICRWRSGFIHYIHEP